MARSEAETKDTAVKSRSDHKTPSVEDFLTAPRRKRRKFILTALGERTASFFGGIESFIKTQNKNIGILNTQNEEELRKAFRKNILLLIIDDSFLPKEILFPALRDLKMQNPREIPPVLFLTKDSQQLIRHYAQELAAFHEIDDYIDYPKSSLAHINFQVKNIAFNANRRRARRYHVDLAIRFFLLSDGRMHQGRIKDLSVHGASILSQDEHFFCAEEQLKLYIPTHPEMSHAHGEFMHISARVRRVMISGLEAGVSFEHLSETQRMSMTEYVTRIARSQLGKGPVRKG